MEVIAVVVARGGSQRLPGKALLPFSGTTIVGRKVDILKACRSVNRVIVGSDCPMILDEALRHGAEAIVRDAFHCDESRCTANDMIADMAAKVGGSEDNLILWAHPTNPLVRPETFDRAVAEFGAASHAGFDSLVSVMAMQRHAWLDGKPFNYDPWSSRHSPASELKPLKFQDGAIFIQPLGKMKANRYFFGDRPWLFSMPQIESTDVDTQADYDIACALSGLI